MSGGGSILDSGQALAVQKEVESRIDEADRIRRQHLERAEHKVEKARLKDAAWITATELGQILRIPHAHIGRWRGEGRVRGRQCNDGSFWLYEPVDRQPGKIRRKAQGHLMIGEKQTRSDAEGAV